MYMCSIDRDPISCLTFGVGTHFLIRAGSRHPHGACMARIAPRSTPLRQASSTSSDQSGGADNLDRL
jgi:hypothetical protein